MNEASRIYHRQRAADIRHHQERIEWLELKDRLNHLETRLLEQSQHIVKNPSHGTNSVDIEADDYDSSWLFSITDKELLALSNSAPT